MKSVLAVVLALLLLCPSVFGGEEYVSYAFGKRYRIEITDEMLAKSPTWNDEVDNPPVSPGKAIRLANALKSRLVKDSKHYKWRLISATLDNDWSSGSAPGRKWWWTIRYEAHVRVGGSSGIPSHLELVVLMDGTVIEPRVDNAAFGE
jgi:hypothetical protein